MAPLRNNSRTSRLSDFGSEDGFVRMQYQGRHTAWQDDSSEDLLRMSSVEAPSARISKLNLDQGAVFPVMNNPMVQQIIQAAPSLEGADRKRMGELQNEVSDSIKFLIGDRMLLQSLDSSGIRSLIDQIELLGTQIVVLNQKRSNVLKEFFDRLHPDYRREQESFRSLIQSINWGVGALRLLLPTPCVPSEK